VLTGLQVSYRSCHPLSLNPGMMKKSIAAPLCSGLVIPGLGQILNQQIRKGVLLMGLVFLPFCAGAVKPPSIITSVTRQTDLAGISKRRRSAKEICLFVAGIVAAFRHPLGLFRVWERLFGWLCALTLGWGQKPVKSYLVDEIDVAHLIEFADF